MASPSAPQSDPGVLIFLILTCIANGFPCSDCPKNRTIMSSEFNLVHRLLEHYDKTVRPRFNSNESVTVWVRFSLQQLYDLDEKRQILRMSGWLTAEWKDEFMTWEPTEFGNLSSVVLDPKKIWTPKLAIGNTADRMFQDYRHFLVTIRHTGVARWQPGGIFSFTCALDMNYYPFDDQTCVMEVETWHYTSEKVNLTNTMSTFGMETYLQHGEWAVLSTEVTREDKTYKYYSSEFFPELYFKILLRRKYTFYFMYILLPCMMLSFVLLMIFLLPADSGEKVSLGVSILIAMSVFLLIVAEQVPDTSDAVPVIAIYLMYFMMATAMSIMTSTLILKLHYRGFDKPPKPWLRFLFFDVLAPLMCLKSLTNWSRKNRSSSYGKTIKNKHKRPIRSNGQCGGDVNSDEDSSCGSSDSTEQRIKFVKESPEKRDSIILIRRQRAVKNHAPVNYDPDKPSPEVLEEWKRLAEVLDRLFFWLFLIFLVIPSISIVGLVRLFKRG